MRRRRGLSMGTVLVLILCAAALVGFFMFVKTLGADSPAAAMQFSELAESLSQAFATPPQAGQASPPPQQGLPMQVTAAQDMGTAQPPFRARDPISLMMTFGGLVRFDSDIVASHTYKQEAGQLLGALSSQMPSDMTVLGFDHVVMDPPPRSGDVVAPSQVLNVLKTAGADGLLLPGMLGQDMGYQAALDTMGAVGKSGLRALGMGNREAVRLQVNGLRLAWLHVGDVVSAAGQRAVTAEERAMLLPEWELGELEAQVQQLRQTSDLVVVTVAWQGGKGQSPTPQQSTLAHRLAQAGADMVLGYGGHQVQQVEVYQLPDAQDGQRDVLIAYSLGTLLTESRNRQDLTAGVLLHVNMLVRPEVHGVQFVELRYTPTYTRKWTEKSSTRFAVLPSDMAPPEGMTRTQRQQMEAGRELIDKLFEGTVVTPQR